MDFLIRSSWLSMYEVFSVARGDMICRGLNYKLMSEEISFSGLASLRLRLVSLSLGLRSWMDLLWSTFETPNRLSPSFGYSF
jgi:hypothetical protein